MTRSARLLAPALLVLATGACAPAIENGAKAATRGAVLGGAEFLQQPGNRRLVSDALGSPEMQQALKDIAASVTDGVSEAMSGRSGAESAAIATSLAAAVARSAVDAALAQATTPENEKRLQELSMLVVDAATRQAIRSMQAAWPAGNGALDESSLRQALSSVAFEVSRQVVFGTNEATGELEHRKQESGTLAHVSKLFSDGAAVLVGLFFVLLAAVVWLSLALVRTRRASRAGS